MFDVFTLLRAGSETSAPFQSRNRRKFDFPSRPGAISLSARVQRIFSFLLLLFLPLAALADGMVIPTIAYPAKITIPDQRALICYSNGTERIVIETRFTGAGTNFAWVVPLPSQPVIEEATTGLFPTLQYLFRPEIVHDVPRYYLGILIIIGLICLFRLLKKYASADFIISLIFFFGFLFLAALLLPALSAAKRGGIESTTSGQNVSILDRKLVGIFETTTIASHDTKALQTWLSENGYAVLTNAESVITSYVKDGWVFVATKVRRDKPDSEISTPHPLSFTFKTDKPVYPMRLTGVDNGPLMVDLYVFSDRRTSAPHFKVESCTRPKIAHPLLHKWIGDSTVATKLTATLSPAEMHKDVWINFSQPPFFEKRNRLFSWQGALTTALNWGVELFAAGMIAASLLAFASETHKTKLPRRMVAIILASIVLVGLVYFALPKIEVKLVKGGYRRSYNNMRQEEIMLRLTLDDGGWQTIAEARAKLRDTISDPNNGPKHWDGSKSWYGWDNEFIGGQFHEEDSPGNYLLRETNNQLQLVFFNPEGGEEISDTWDLHTQP